MSPIKVYSKKMGNFVLWWACQKYICYIYFVIKFVGHSFYYNNKINIFSIMEYYLGKEDTITCSTNEGKNKKSKKPKNHKINP
jgi:hypothetical protein